MMGGCHVSRGACAHPRLAGYLGSRLQGRGVEVVEDLVDFDAGELVLVGQRRLDGCDGVLAFCQELFVGLDGVADEVTGVEWSGVVVGGPCGCGECDGLALGLVDVVVGAVVEDAVDGVLGGAGDGDLEMYPHGVRRTGRRDRREVLNIPTYATNPMDVSGYDSASQRVGDDSMGGFVAASLLDGDVFAELALAPNRFQPFDGFLGSPSCL